MTARDLRAGCEPIKPEVALLRRATIFLFVCLNLWVAAIAQATESSRPAASTSAGWWNGNIWEDPDRGFYWYPPDRPPEEEEKEDPKTTESAPIPKSIYEMTTSDEVNKEMKRLLDVAIFNPTDPNVLEYQRAKQYVMKRADYFSQVGTALLMKYPDIDWNATVPITTFGNSTKAEVEKAEKLRTIAKLSDDYGLLFFFKSDCPYCHAQAPVMDNFNKWYGMDVLSISLDGKGITGYPDFKPDNGISMLVSNGQGIATVPALYLVSRDKKNVVPLGAGTMSVEQIAERIHRVIDKKPQDR